MLLLQIHIAYAICQKAQKPLACATIIKNLKKAFNLLFAQSEFVEFVLFQQFRRILGQKTGSPHYRDTRYSIVQFPQNEHFDIDF